MAEQKFGTRDNQPLTGAINAYAPGIASKHFGNSRIVTFSTGNVYPLTTIASGGVNLAKPTHFQELEGTF